MYKKTIKIASLDKKLDFSILRNEIARNLEEVEARNVEVLGNLVKFKGGVFRFVTNWNVLYSITSGEIHIDQEKNLIKYKLSFSQLMLIISIVVAVMGMSSIVNDYSFSDYSLSMVILDLSIIWFLLVGINIIITLPRFHKFLKRSIRGAGFDVI
jgi:succinate dehydrogenase hydrophobic anchor subunit